MVRPTFLEIAGYPHYESVCTLVLLARQSALELVLGWRLVTRAFFLGHVRERLDRQTPKNQTCYTPPLIDFLETVDRLQKGSSIVATQDIRKLNVRRTACQDRNELEHVLIYRVAANPTMTVGIDVGVTTEGWWIHFTHQGGSLEDLRSLLGHLSIPYQPGKGERLSDPTPPFAFDAHIDQIRDHVQPIIDKIATANQM